MNVNGRADRIGCNRFLLDWSEEQQALDIKFSCYDCRQFCCFQVFLAAAIRAEHQAESCALGIKFDLKPAPLPVYAREEVGFAIGPGYCPCPDDCGEYIDDGAMRLLSGI